MCNQTPETRPPTERSIADLTVSRLIADINTCLKGYCCLVLKPHVIEIYDVSDEDSSAFMRDVKVASLALRKVTATVKINYEIHGNTIPHMHMHLYPRGKVRRRVNERGRCNLRFAVRTAGATTPEQKETPPVKKKRTTAAGNTLAPHRAPDPVDS